MKERFKSYAIAGTLCATVILGSVTAIADPGVYKGGANEGAAFERVNQLSEEDAKGGFRGKAFGGHFMDFSQLVEDGVISQATADKITTFMEAKTTEKKAEMESFKGKNTEEGKPTFEGGKPEMGERVDFFEEMVTSGVITQAEADAIKEAMPKQQADGRGFMKGGGNHAAGFSRLVEDGVISQTTADNMEQYMKNQEETKKAEMESFKNMSEDEKKAYFESAKPQKTDIYEEMVKAGVITQSEADAIKASMPERKEPPKPDAAVQQ